MDTVGYIVLALVAAAVILAAVYMFRHKKSGGCASCVNRDSCPFSGKQPSEGGCASCVNRGSCPFSGQKPSDGDNLSCADKEQK